MLHHQGWVLAVPWQTKPLDQQGRQHRYLPIAFLVPTGHVWPVGSRPVGHAESWFDSAEKNSSSSLFNS
eukprot:1303529-Amphidinium_carterae.1